jgi:fatty-acyl-CoA synthase
VGDQVMASIVLRDEASLTPGEFEEFLAQQPDLPRRGWPRYVRIVADLPSTATNKVLKRELVRRGVHGGDGVLWVRHERGTGYEVQM